MKVLITGATGLVGQALSKLLWQNGHTVHFLTTQKNKLVDEPLYKGYYWNPQQGKIDVSCIDGVDAIVHLAGATVAKRWTTEYKQEIIESRINTTNLLYKLLKNNQHTVRNVVSASAIGIYPHSFTTYYDENATQTDDTFLGQVVVRWENAVNSLELLGLKVCKIRIGLVLAKESGALVEMIKPIKLGLGAPLGSGKQMQSWIHIHDLARIFFMATQQEWIGVYNAVAPTPVDNTQLTKSIAKALHKPLLLPNVPKFVLRLALGEMHELLFSSQYVSSKKVQDKGFTFDYQTIDDALSHLLK